MIRTMFRQPTATLVIVLTLSVGLGAMGVVTALFTAVVFPVNPYRDVERLVTVWPSVSPGSTQRADYLMTRRTDTWLSAPPRSFERLAALGSTSGVLRHGDAAHRVTLTVVTGSFFPMLGARAQLGRMLTAADSVASSEPAIVVGDRAWRKFLQADPDIIGKPVRIDSTVYTVAGVAPPEMEYPRGADIWVPRVHSAGHRQPVAWLLLGRLRDGTAFTTARAEVIARSQAEHQADSTAYGGRGITALEFRTATSSFGSGLFPLVGLCLVALYLIAVLNLGILLLLHASRRAGEFAIRAALGSGTWGAVRPLIFEISLQFALGCAIAFAVAVTALRVIRNRFLFDLAPITGRAEITVLVAILLIAFVTAAVVMPLVARYASAVDLFGMLRRSGEAVTEDRSARRLRRLLVGSEIALAMVLACAAASVARSLHQYRSIDVGYDATRTVVARPDYVALKYDHARQLAIAEEAHARLRGANGVADATYWRKLSQGWPPPQPEQVFQIQGRGTPPMRDQLFGYYEVGPRFFETLGARIIEGRSFNSNDTRGSLSVAIVTRIAAERWWPGESAIGKRVSLNPADPASWMTIVGVTRLVGMDPRFDRAIIAWNGPRPLLFRPIDQSGPALTPYWNWQLDCYVCPSVAIAVRAQASTAAAGVVLRRTLQEFEPNLPLAATPTMYYEQVHDSGGEMMTSYTRVMSGFAMVAVLLALLGVYGVVAGNVARRTRELAIRISLGATRVRLVRMLLAENVSLTIVAIGAGAILYIWVQQIAGGLLFGGPARSPLHGASASDPHIIVPVLILSSATIALAVAVASRTALRQDPQESLRAD